MPNFEYKTAMQTNKEFLDALDSRPENDDSDLPYDYIGEYPAICQKIKRRARWRLLLDPRVWAASILGFILCIYFPIESFCLFCRWVYHEPGLYNVLFLFLQVLWLPFMIVYIGIMSDAFFSFSSLHIDIRLKESPLLSTEDERNDYNKRFEPMQSSGSRICSHCKTLDRIARSLDCRTISEMGFDENTWFAPEDGLKTTNALIDYFQHHPEEDRAWLRHKLVILKIALEYSRDRQIPFHFIIVQ